MFDEIRKHALEYIESCLASHYAISQDLVLIIPRPDHVEPLCTHNTHLLLAENTTIKLEGFENYNTFTKQWCQEKANQYKHSGPITAHIFVSPEAGFSFKAHTDPDNVLLVVVDGKKTMEIDGVHVTIETGCEHYMPTNTVHKATNHHYSVMISLGLEQWIRDKL